jgi:hypothetical protein
MFFLFGKGFDVEGIAFIFQKNSFYYGKETDYGYSPK